MTFFHVAKQPNHHEPAACMRSTDSLASQHACCRLSSNQRGQPCPRQVRNVFNGTHILQERRPTVGVVPKQAVIVHDVIQHIFRHPR